MMDIFATRISGPGRTAVCLLLLFGGQWVAPAVASVTTGDYQGHPQALDFIDEMVAKHGFDRQQLASLIVQAQRKQSILDAIARPAEKTKPWKEYRKIFLTEQRIRQGVDFWRQHASLLDKVEQAYGVDKAIIVAILGVETRYGAHTGRYRVLDALATLGFDYPPRAPFFRGQLEHYLLMTREQGLAAEQLLGSYAGAMGWGQFIPSSYRHFAVDFDGDQQADIWQNPADAIASVANYFKQHGWRHQSPVTVPSQPAEGFDAALANSSKRPHVSLAEVRRKGYGVPAPFDPEEQAMVMRLAGEAGDEFWLGFHNFYVITRYNHSELYAMAVYQLSQAIAAEVAKP